MKDMKTLLPLFASALWITLSEFVRNKFLLESYWVEHYQRQGLIFPSEPINGAIWGVWSLLFAGAIFLISTKFTLAQTTALSWFVGFVLMWLVVGNLGFLPNGLLYFAVPLSLLEVFVAALIVVKLSKK